MHVDAAAMRPVLSRQVALRGPKFFRDGRELMFVNHLDGSTREGPRHATDEDKKAHPAAYQAHLDELHAPVPEAPVPPLMSTTEPHGKPPREKSENELKREAARERGERA